MNQNRKGETHILAVAIDDYPGKIVSKGNAVTDVSEFLELNVERYGVLPKNIIELFDARATRKNLFEKIGYLTEVANDQDDLIIYFSIIGIFDSQTGNNSYHLADGIISQEEVDAQINKLKLKNVFIIFDFKVAGDMFPPGEAQVSVDTFWGLDNALMLVSGRNAEDQESPLSKSLLFHLRENFEDQLDVGILTDNILKELNPNRTHSKGVDVSGNFVFYLTVHIPVIIESMPTTVIRESASMVVVDSHSDVSPGDETGMEAEVKVKMEGDSKGKLTHDIPENMELKKPTKCLVRIAQTEEVLLEGWNKPGTPVESVTIAKVMDVDLIDISDGVNFKIMPVSNDDQFLEEGTYTQWMFYVTPLLPGAHPLLLKVATVQIIDGKERTKDIVLEKIIDVKSEDTPAPADPNSFEGRIHHLKILLAKDLKEFFNKLNSQLDKDSEKMNMFVIQFGRFASTNQSLEGGLIPFDEADLVFNNIRNAMTKWLDSLEDKDLLALM